MSAMLRFPPLTCRGKSWLLWASFGIHSGIALVSSLVSSSLPSALQSEMSSLSLSIQSAISMFSLNINRILCRMIWHPTVEGCGGVTSSSSWSSFWSNGAKGNVPSGFQSSVPASSKPSTTACWTCHVRWEFLRQFVSCRTTPWMDCSRTHCCRC